MNKLDKLMYEGPWAIRIVLILLLLLLFVLLLPPGPGWILIRGLVP